MSVNIYNKSAGTLTKVAGRVIAKLMGGATSTTAGEEGLVPAPAAGDNTSFLRGDGTWVSIDNFVVLTKSEYEALGSEKLTNGVYYFITN